MCVQHQASLAPGSPQARNVGLFAAACIADARFVFRHFPLEEIHPHALQGDSVRHDGPYTVESLRAAIESARMSGRTD